MLLPDPLQQRETSLLAALQLEEQSHEATLSAYRLTPSPSLAQIENFISQIATLLRRLDSYRLAANQLANQRRDTSAQLLQKLIERAKYNLQTLQLSAQSARAFQAAMSPASTPNFPGADPPPDPSRRLMASLGHVCYHCGLSLALLGYTPNICPRCGRFPTPPPR
jgi:hypothetical protein